MTEEANNNYECLAKSLEFWLQHCVNRGTLFHVNHSVDGISIITNASINILPGLASTVKSEIGEYGFDVKYYPPNGRDMCVEVKLKDASTSQESFKTAIAHLEQKTIEHLNHIEGGHLRGAVMRWEEVLARVEGYSAKVAKMLRAQVERPTLQVKEGSTEMYVEKPSQSAAL